MTGKVEGNRDVPRPMMGKKSRMDNTAAQRARTYWVAGSFPAIQGSLAAVLVSSSAVPALVSGGVVSIGLVSTSGVEL